MRRSPMRQSRRQTGPDAKTRNTVYERDGMACVVCCGGFPLQVHHRRPRAAGGSRREDTNGPQNLVVVCAEHHAWLESNREVARQRGYLVPQHTDPADVPIIWRGRWSWLRPDGTVEPVRMCDPNREGCCDDSPCLACPRGAA